MKIIVFSKQEHLNELLQEKFTGIDGIEQVINCNSFHDIDVEVKKEHNLIVYHLLSGELEEKIFYQFLNLYKLSNKVFVISNNPTPEQGKRLFSAGIKAYTNTFISANKLSMAVKTIQQGNVWMGDEIAKTFKELGVNSSNLRDDDKVESDVSSSDEGANDGQPKQEAMIETPQQEMTQAEEETSNQSHTNEDEVSQVGVVSKIVSSIKNIFSR